jgi:uncharacterized protein YdbL (DUF1318 family)
MSEADRLTVDEQFVLCWWSVQALAEELKISEDAAEALLEAAYAQGRVAILGNGYFAGVQCDGKWVVVEGRANLTRATREWQTLRAMERQLEE